MKKLNNYLNDKNNLLVFLIILIGVLVPLFSGHLEYNFWLNLLNILTSPTSILFLFIAAIINIYRYLKYYFNKLNLIGRFTCVREYINYFYKDIILMSIYLYFIFLILSISGSILLSFNNFNIISYSYYNISLPVYLIIFMFKELPLFIILNITIYYIICINNKYVLFTTLIMLVLMFYKSSYKDIINNVSQMYILFPYYFQRIEYQNILLEILCFLLQIFLLIILNRIIYNQIIKKKRDLL